MRLDTGGAKGVEVCGVSRVWRGPDWRDGADGALARTMPLPGGSK